MSISYPHRNMRTFTALLILSLFAACDSAPVEDLVESLPGYGAPPSTMYSGFLNTSAADPVAAVQLHYIFTQTTRSDIKATEAPVVLWLNGGPGSSSILGLMEEWGPLILNATGGFVPEPLRMDQISQTLCC